VRGEANSKNAASDAAAEGVTLSHIAAIPALRAEGAGATITIQMTCQSREGLRALGLIETIPPGWRFAGVERNTTPPVFIVPDTGREGPLEFIWVDVPSMPCTFTYRIVASDMRATSDALVTGQVLYRYGAGELRSNIAAISLAGTASRSLLAAPIEKINDEPPAIRSGSPVCEMHSADYYDGGDWEINLTEILRIIQFYNTGSYHCDASGEDGYAPGSGSHDCDPHDADYSGGPDWSISFSELLRIIQFYNSGGYHPDDEGEDNFAPGKFINDLPPGREWDGDVGSVNLSVSVSPELWYNSEAGYDQFEVLVGQTEPEDCSKKEFEVHRIPFAIDADTDEYPIYITGDEVLSTLHPRTDAPSNTIGSFEHHCYYPYSGNQTRNIEFLDEYNEDAVLTVRVMCTAYPDIYVQYYDFHDK